ncbi:MAG: hypothetical protein DRQ55_05765 [Planctomycetota bacterium]|nr:MAG: hypothetical protein DRQ55_05765 [Planctomycetota bacterium]
MRIPSMMPIGLLSGALLLGASLTPADAGTPEQAAVVIKSTGSFLGNGVLIDDTWVLTTATILGGSPLLSELTVTVGDANLDSVDGTEQTVSVANYILAQPPYDIALIEFASPVAYSPAVLPMSLPSNGADFTGQTSDVTGWWTTDPCANGIDNLLASQPMPVISNAEAASYFGNDVNPWHLAILDGASTFHHGSGTGVYVEENGQATLGGLVSFGASSGGCADGSFPTVCTRVSYFVSWIDSQPIDWTPGTTPLAVGELHNALITDYYTTHAPTPASQLTSDDAVAILDNLGTSAIALGLNATEVQSAVASIMPIIECGGPLSVPPFPTSTGWTFPDPPIVFDYTMSQIAPVYGSRICSTLEDLQVYQVANSPTPQGMVSHMSQTLNSITWTAVEQPAVDMYLDVASHSQQLWFEPGLPGGSLGIDWIGILGADAAGAMSGMCCPPYGPAVGAAFFSLAYALESHAPPPKVPYGGLPHTALGNALVSSLEAPGLSQLHIIAAPTTTALDGAHIAYNNAAGPALFHEVFMAPIDPQNALPSGASLKLISQGTLNGVDERRVGTLTATKVGSSIQYDADFSSIGSTTQTIEVYDGNQRVASVSGHSGVAFTADGWLEGFFRGWPADNWSPSFGSSTLITIPGGPTVMGNQVNIIAENVTFSPTNLSSMRVHIQDIPQLTLIDEQTWGFEWNNEGFALPGVNGDPLFVGSGDLTAGSANPLELSNAAPLANAALFWNLQSAPVNFKGGTVVPGVAFYVYPFTTSAAGEISVSLGVPSTGLPVGTEFWLQWLIQDSMAVHNYAFSNAIKGVSP